MFVKVNKWFAIEVYIKNYFFVKCWKILWFEIFRVNEADVINYNFLMNYGAKYKNFI